MSTGDAKPASTRRRIEEQLNATGVRWTGVDTVPRDAVASGDFSRGLSFIRHVTLDEMARELASLPPGGQLALVSAEQQYWLAVREGAGIQLAPVGSPEATALAVTHRARTDLQFLGAKVELAAAGGDEGLRVTAMAPASSKAAGVGLLPNDFLALSAEELVKRALPKTVRARGADGKESVTLPAGHPSVAATEQALQRRLGGVPVPVGHWLASALRPGAERNGARDSTLAGALLTSASVDGRAVWTVGDSLEALDAAGEAAKQAGRALAVSLVTAEGFETATLTAQTDASWRETAERRVEVTLTAHSAKGSEVRELLRAGAPYGFAIARGHATLKRPTQQQEPAVTVPTWLDPQALRDYEDSTEGVVAQPDELRRETPERLAFLETQARQTVDELRAFQGKLARVNPNGSDRALASALARVEAETEADLGLALQHLPAPSSGGPRPSLSPDPGQLWAEQVVQAISRVAQQRSLPVEERHGRMTALLRFMLESPWYQREPGEQPPTPAVLASELGRIAETPTFLLEPSTTSSASAEEAQDRAPIVAAHVSEESLADRLSELEGVVDAWKDAVWRGEAVEATRYEDLFDQARRRFEEPSDAAGASNGEAMRQRYRALVRLASEVVDESERAAAQLAGPEALHAGQTIRWLSSLLNSVREGATTGERALKQLEVHRAAESGQLVEGQTEVPERVTAAPPSSDQRFSSLAELERFLEGLEATEVARLSSADGRQFLVIAKRYVDGKRLGWSVSPGTSEPEQH